MRAGRIAALLLALLLLSAPAAAKGPVTAWSVSRHYTAITFSARQMGTAFEGVFLQYEPDIRFDPDRLEESRVVFDFDVASLSTGDRDRDQAALSAPWFNAAAFPRAVFRAEAFRRTGKNSYVAEGALTIRDVTLPVTLSFTLEITPHNRGRKKARLLGTATLDRLNFGLGTGEWADESTVGRDVTVKVDLTAFSIAPENTP